MGAEENRKTVQLVYEAFNRGEINLVFDSLADDVVWTNHSWESSPLRGVFSGKTGVEQFFSNLDQIELERFDVKDIIAVEDTVIVLIDYKANVKRTGKSVESTLVHLMTLRDGKLATWDEYEDNAPNPWV
ncbi:MAG: nuclear transport factor 2 family protein [Actinomycetota bacterium]